MTAPQDDDFGPWIEWNGGPRPVSMHDWVHLVFDDKDEFTGTCEGGGISAKGFVIDASSDDSWTWATSYEFGLGGDARIIRYRLKKPRALLDLIQLIADLPAPVKTDGVIA